MTCMIYLNRTGKSPWQCRGSGVFYTRRTTSIYGCQDILFVPNIKKKCHIFLSTFCGFLTDNVLVDEVCDQRFYDVERLLVKYGYFTATGTAMPAVTALEGSFMLKMKRKTLFYTLFLPILLLNLSSIEIRAEGHEAVGISEQTDLRLAAWNIRIMSHKSRSDAELIEIARTLADYDFIAIVELRDEMVLKRTQKILSQMGKMYDYEFSPAVGRGSKERYAFLYSSKLVSVVRHGELYPDAGGWQR